MSQSVTLSRDEFHADPQAAEAASQRGPVFIASNGDPVSVMMSYRDYCILRFGDFQSAAAILGAGDAGDVDFDSSLAARQDVQREVTL
ncbi:hypothetical protein F183_A07300 [Bryobacterales bacterium F-183]|nr:hypothetical protein F183_A07300 [Bryobacterales bacterium F-183]